MRRSMLAIGVVLVFTVIAGVGARTALAIPAFCDPPTANFNVSNGTIHGVGKGVCGGGTVTQTHVKVCLYIAQPKVGFTLLSPCGTNTGPASTTVTAVTPSFNCSPRTYKVTVDTTGKDSNGNPLAYGSTSKKGTPC